MTEISIADHGLVGDLQTAALISTDGSGRLVLLPPASTEATDNHRLVRMAHCVRGEMSFASDLVPGSTTGVPRTC